ncbi:MAG: hypothetical protein MRZ54_07670 [Clostridiales bacterium]|nr:hypothetical protein [Clostridiales bacterium]
MNTGKKAKAALCILLACLCVPLACPCAACAKTITLPDLGDFAAGRNGDMQIEIYVNEPLQRRYHIFSKHEYAVVSTVSAYVSTVMADYGFTLEGAIVGAAGAHEWYLKPDPSLRANADSRMLVGCGPYEDDSAQVVLVGWFEGVSMAESSQKIASSDKQDSSGKQASSGGTAASENRESKKTPSPRQTPKPTPKRTEKPRRAKCHAIGCNSGKVKCRKCDGKGYKIKTVTVPNYSGKSRTTKEQKEYCSCNFGYNSCSTCGGDGWVND